MPDRHRRRSCLPANRRRAKSRCRFRHAKFQRSAACPTIAAFSRAPALDARSTSIARAIPFSVMASARRIRRSSSSVFASRSGQKSPFVVCELESCSLPVPARNRAGNSRARLRNARLVFAKNARALFHTAALSSSSLESRVRTRCKERTRPPALVLRPRSISRSLNTNGAFSVLLEKNNGSGTKKCVA